MYSDETGILYVEDTDDLGPLQALLNALQAGTSEALSLRTPIWQADTVAQRNALVPVHNPTPSKPLIVWRSDAAEGYQLEYTTNGTNWFTVRAPQETRRVEYGRNTFVPNTVAPGAGTSNGGTVLFSTPMPSNDYDVQVTVNNAPGGTANLVPRAISQTASGFSIYLYNVGSSPAQWSSPLLVRWRAEYAA